MSQNYKEDKEIMDLIKDIKSINEQIANPNDEIRQVITEVQKALQEKAFAYELAGVKGDISRIYTIDKIDVEILWRKLPDYKKMCLMKLLDKCGQIQYEEIMRKENL